MQVRQPTITFGAPTVPLGWTEPRNVGWECPRCHATYAWWMSTCVHCKPTVSTGEIDWSKVPIEELAARDPAGFERAALLIMRRNGVRR